MAFCKNKGKKIKEFLEKVKGIEGILSEVLKITGAVKALPGSAVVQDIDALIPDGSKTQVYFNKAISAILGVAIKVEETAQAIFGWLQNKTDLAKNSDLIKLAAVATSVQQQEEQGIKHEESFYDTAAQTHAVGLK